MAENGRLDVYTDGDCPLCRWMREKVEPFDRNQRIEWRNYRDPKVREATPYSFEELDAEMHTQRTSDGRWAAGFDSWIEIMRVLPRWWLLAPVLSFWPIRKLGHLFYRALAKRRYKLFGIPPPCDPNGACALHKPTAENTTKITF